LILEFSSSNTWNRQLFDFDFLFKYPKLEIIQKNQIPQHWNRCLMVIRVIMQVPIGGSQKQKQKNQRIGSNNVYITMVLAN
jgi:hypothetical protein